MTCFFRLFACIVLLLLSACNAAGPHFRHLPATRLTVEGTTFDVRVSRQLAEAIRITPQYAPRLGPIGARAARAMQIVSGCEVTEVRGDAAQITGLLDCCDAPEGGLVVIGLNYECYAIEDYLGRSDELDYLAYDCEAVLY